MYGRRGDPKCSDAPCGRQGPRPHTNVTPLVIVKGPKQTQGIASKKWTKEFL
jgi:hypothetical protein